MSELYPPDADLDALSGTADAEQDVLFIPIGESPYYNSFYKMLHRLLMVARRAGDLRVYKDGDLTFGVRAGRYLNGDTPVDYAGATGQGLTDNATNYIYLTADGTLTVNTTGFPVPSVTPHIPLATIVTASGTYDGRADSDGGDVTDYRGRAFISVRGSAAGNPAELDWQASVLDRDLTSPPGSPSQGDRYIVAAGGSGDWSGLDGHIVEYNGTSWTDVTPSEGTVTLVEDEDILVGYNGSAWVDLGTFANIRDLTDGGNADALHTHDTAGLADGAVTAAKLDTTVAGNCLTGGGGSPLSVVADGTSISGGGGTLHLADTAAGAGLSRNASNGLDVNVDDTTIEIAADTLRIKDAGITNAKLAGSIDRSKLAEQSLVEYRVPLGACTNVDGTVIQAAADSPGDAEFRIEGGLWGDGSLLAKTKDIVGDAQSVYAAFEFPLPAEYIAGQDVQLVVHCRYDGTGTNGASLIDAEVYKLTDAGACGSDLCQTPFQNISSAFADYTFTIDATGLAPSDRLRVLLCLRIEETGGSDALHGELGGVRMKLDIQG